MSPSVVKQLLTFVILGVLGWYGYAKYESYRATRVQEMEESVASASPAARVEPAPASQFSCDGRTHCSEMRSCAEATYFLRNCPGTKMDGDGDGVPCEQQFCR